MSVWAPRRTLTFFSLEKCETKWSVHPPLPLICFSLCNIYIFFLFMPFTCNFFNKPRPRISLILLLLIHQINVLKTVNVSFQTKKHYHWLGYWFSHVDMIALHVCAFNTWSVPVFVFVLLLLLGASPVCE